MSVLFVVFEAGVHCQIALPLLLMGLMSFEPVVNELGSAEVTLSRTKEAAAKPLGRVDFVVGTPPPGGTLNMSAQSNWVATTAAPPVSRFVSVQSDALPKHAFVTSALS